MELTFKIKIEFQDKTVCEVPFQIELPLPEPPKSNVTQLRPPKTRLRKRQLSDDPFARMRPSEHGHPAKRAQFLMRRHGIKVDVEDRGKGWFRITQEGDIPRLIQGVKKLDAVTAEAIRIRKEENAA